MERSTQGRDGVLMKSYFLFTLKLAVPIRDFEISPRHFKVLHKLIESWSSQTLNFLIQILDIIVFIITNCLGINLTMLISLKQKVEIVRNKYRAHYFLIS